LIGLTDDVLKKLEQRQGERKAESTTPLYQDIAAMKASRLSPSQWRNLSGTDRKVLHYFRVMEIYHIEFSPERIKMREDTKAAERAKRDQHILGKMPGLAPRGRRR